MGQANGKKEIEDGLKLLKDCKDEKAHRRWKLALEKTRDKSVRFVMIGHLNNALFEIGRFRETASYSIEQLTCANILDRRDMKAEAYWNLARANVRMGEYQKSLSFGKHALSNAATKDPTYPLLGSIHMTMAESSLAMGDFQSALEYGASSLEISTKSDNLILECETYGFTGDLYLTLKDYDKAMKQYIRANEMIRCLGQPWTPQLRARMLLRLAKANRKLGVLDRALQNCEDAMKLAIQENNQIMQARCLCALADVHRSRGDVERAHTRYETSWSQATEMGDRVCKLDILMGLVKLFSKVREYDKALDAAARALELASTISSKIHVLRCHWLMHQLYRQSDRQIALSHEHAQAFDRFLIELQLYCSVCHDVIGAKKDKIHSLQCCHFFHSRCIENSSVLSRGCPNCKSKTILTKPVHV